MRPSTVKPRVNISGFITTLLICFSASTFTQSALAEPTVNISGDRISAERLIHQGREIYTNTKYLCANCHGPNGEGDPTIFTSRLGGKQERYIYQQLKNYADGTRQDNTMQVMADVANRLTLQQWQAVAAYLAQLSGIPPER